jgi:preprotein translocase subunit SecA
VRCFFRFGICPLRLSFAPNFPGFGLRSFSTTSATARLTAALLQARDAVVRLRAFFRGLEKRSVVHWFDSSWFHPAFKRAPIEEITEARTAMEQLSDAALRVAYESADQVEKVIAIGAVAAERVLGQRMFDVQLAGAWALANGRIAEMQTGEGKTLACVPAVLWYARKKLGVHVMTVNDYLARRDATWMGDIYRLLGLSVAFVQQGMSIAERAAAYRADVTYATATEIGFDYLRDQMALYPVEQVQRSRYSGGFAAAVIDEADSILIDEARIPLVIAGGGQKEDALPLLVDPVARQMRHKRDFVVQENSLNVSLTDAGIERAEQILGQGNLYAPDNLALLAALQNALHAHVLLHRDVDYIVKEGAVKSVDEWKGRVVQDRRWPAGLHTALEVKEGVRVRPEGVILGSVTLQNLIALYREVCGMTGTAASQAAELRQIYGLAVETIPTHRPMIRMDHADRLFETKREKERAVVQEIRRVHASGQPVLVGTVSVEESERLSSMLRDIPHRVLNARDEEQEAAIIACAGQRDAVTVSTNMAGRGTDICLGGGVAGLGGLYVMGTNRHESRRIDYQLRGRAGRQGDPGESRFFVSLEDDLVLKYGGANPEEMQRFAEGQNLKIRLFLQKYESAIEGQRLKIQALRQSILSGEKPCASELERLVALRTIDDLWSQHLSSVGELKAGIHWRSWSGKDPLYEFLTQAHRWFQELEAELEGEIARRLAEASASGVDPSERGAVWTYLTTDQPFGTWTERMARGAVRLGKQLMKRYATIRR